MATVKLFRVSRPDGRSYRDVIYELVQGKEPGEVISYGEMLTALDKGDSRKHDKAELSMIVAGVNKTLLANNKRVLRCVKTVGYRVAEAKEHWEVARGRKKRGDRQYRWAMNTLTNTNVEELSPEEKRRHDALVVVLNNHHHRISGHERRIEKLEETIRRLTGQGGETG